MYNPKSSIENIIGDDSVKYSICQNNDIHLTINEKCCHPNIQVQSYIKKSLFLCEICERLKKILIQRYFIFGKIYLAATLYDEFIYDVKIKCISCSKNCVNNYNYCLEHTVELFNTITNELGNDLGKIIFYYL